MDLNNSNDAVARRMAAMVDRISGMKNNDEFYYNMPVSELRGGSKVIVHGREMGMYASYSYLGLVGHPRINKAAQDAVSRHVAN